jgi:hypothetical protein
MRHFVTLPEERQKAGGSSVASRGRRCSVADVRQPRVGSRHGGRPGRPASLRLSRLRSHLLMPLRLHQRDRQLVPLRTRRLHIRNVQIITLPLLRARLWRWHNPALEHPHQIPHRLRRLILQPRCKPSSQISVQSSHCPNASSH